MDYAPKVSLAAGLAPVRSLTQKEQKGRFLNVIFDRIKLRKLDLPEDTATKRSCWVYYTRMHSLYPYVRGHSIVYFIYNTHRRGLAELLILVKRQCEGQIRWDKRGSFSHVFFVSVFKLLT